MTLDFAAWGEGLVSTRSSPFALWQAVAEVLAESADPGPAFAACEAAFAAGVPPAEAQHVLDHLSDDARTRLLARLRAKHPDVKWNPLHVAAVMGAEGDRDALFKVLLDSLQGPAHPQVLYFAPRLIALDAARADSALWELAKRWNWDPFQYKTVGDALRGAGHASRAERWEAVEVGDRERRAAKQLTDARRAVTEHPADADAWWSLYLALDGALDRAETVSALRKVIELAPMREDALESLVDLDPAGALPDLEAAAARLPSVNVLGLLARCLLGAGRGPDALAVVLRLPSDASTAWWEAGAALLDPGKALAALDVTLKSPVHAGDARLQRARAQALGALGRTKEAVAYLRDELGDDVVGTDTLPVLLDLDPAAAVGLCKDLGAKHPSDLRYPVALVQSLLAAGRLDEADALAGTMNLDGVTEYVEGRDIARAKAGSREVLARLERAADDGGDWWTLARAYLALGRTADAKRALDRLADSGNLAWLIRRAVLK